MRLDADIANKEIHISVLKGSDAVHAVRVQKQDGSYVRFDQYMGTAEAEQGQEAPLIVEFFPWKDAANYSETLLLVNSQDPREANIVFSGNDSEEIRVKRAYFRCRAKRRDNNRVEVLFYGMVDLVI